MRINYAIATTSNQTITKVIFYTNTKGKQHHQQQKTVAVKKKNEYKKKLRKTINTDMQTTGIRLPHFTFCTKRKPTHKQIHHRHHQRQLQNFVQQKNGNYNDTTDNKRHTHSNSKN